MSNKYLFFPGCSLKEFAGDYEKSLLTVFERVGLELKELSSWNCCGVVSNLAEDSIYHEVAPVRNLIRAQEDGTKENVNKLAVACAMCYQVMKKTNLDVKKDPERLERLNLFMNDEPDYKGNVEVLHVLDILTRDEVISKIKENVKQELKGLKIACYYGCALVRPDEVAIADNDDPWLMEYLVENLGATPAEWAYRTQCCGSYNILMKKDVIKKRIVKMIEPLIKDDVDVIITACPLCAYNLEEGMKLGKSDLKQKTIPVVYLTDIVAASLGDTNELSPEKRNILNDLMKKTKMKIKQSV